MRWHSLGVAAILLAAGAAHAGVTVSDAWIRAMAPGQKTAAAYFTLTSSEDAKVVGVSTAAAAKAQLHTSTMASGVAHMDHIEALALPARKPVALKPGGNHVMLMQVARPLRAGDRVPLVLTLEDAHGKRSTVEVTAAVRPIGE